MLTSDYLRAFNAAYGLRIRNEQGIGALPLPVNEAVRHHDVISEVAFHVARQSVEQNIDMAAAFRADAVRFAAIHRTQDLLMSVYQGDAAPFALTSAEWDEVWLIVQTYDLFFRLIKKDVPQFVFEPKFAGLGFLSECRGDLSAGTTLFEIKTVTRGIHGRDIRQLLLYLTLQAATGDRRWSHGGFFNPRRALMYQFQIEEVIQQISGGRTSSEVFAEIGDFLASREIQVDSRF